ncbi:MAG: hypothetical protein ACRC28_17155 [Clostridium sp.]|uniref:hypothetical protein n=1 Tax=Clostridium sp. TaxID=1506 RepID=UPI003F2AB147
MKKFLIVSLAVFIGILFIQFGFLGRIFNSGDTNYKFKTEDKNIMINNNGKWEPFLIKGMNLTAATPGNTPAQETLSEENFLKWINQIGEMGINVIRVNSLMPPKFYEALDEYNKSHKNTIYLLQGIYFDETYLKDGGNPTSKEAIEYFKNEEKEVVDAIHGNSNISGKFLEKYRVDVSKYVMGYTIGNPWSPGDIIYSEIMSNTKSFKGKYFYTEKDSTSFDAFIAEMANYIEEQEQEVYGDQKLITFVGDTNIKNEINQYNEINKNYNNIGNENIQPYIDGNKIKSTYKVKAGMFVSYNLLTQKTNGSYNNLLKELKDFNNHPIIASEIGIPSGRGNLENGITEEEQGNELVSMYKSLLKNNISGGFIYEWCDGWFRSSSEMQKRVVDGKNQYWYNAENYAENYGLLSFIPGTENSPLNTGEPLSAKDEIGSNEDMKVSASSNPGYLYIRIDGKNNIDLKDKKIIIPISVDNSFGGNEFDGINFKDKYNFMIELSKESGQILVSRYYNTNEFLNNEFENKIRPDLMFKDKDTDDFMQEKMTVSSENEKKDINIGKLEEGDIFPNSKNYNSLADYTYGENYVEVKIPWALLNFMDPSTGKIEDDFYQSFNISPKAIGSIRIGTVIEKSESNSIIEGMTYKLNQWIMPEYYEKLKPSYFILKKYFNEVGGN